jgi:mannose-6-phosphate isomerase-like protein (cupin superfamily)
MTAAVAPMPTLVPLDPELLTSIVTGLAQAEDLWRGHVAHDARERVRTRLLATDAYEVWLLGWSPGQGVGLHDHGDANGAFIVVDGDLVETRRGGCHLVDEHLPTGAVGTIPAGHVHDVRNRSARNATSIHAYSRPLTSMGFYDGRGALERVEAVHEQAAVLTDGLRFGPSSPRIA